MFVSHRYSRRPVLLLLAGVMGTALLAGAAFAQWERVQPESGQILAEHVISSPPPAESGTDHDTEAWTLTLVNEDHPLPENWTVETKALPNGKEVDVRIYDALIEMLSAGESEGLRFVVCSAYRTLAYQRQLFDAQTARYMVQGFNQAEAEAKTVTEISVPGTSEHNLGLAVDIVSLNDQLLDEHQAETPEQQWLMAHCWEYGFILRYPEGKSDLTGIIYEPWHYRYVGKEAAKAITEQGLCFEEYLDSIS